MTDNTKAAIASVIFSTILISLVVVAFVWIELDCYPEKYELIKDSKLNTCPNYTNRFIVEQIEQNTGDILYRIRRDNPWPAKDRVMSRSYKHDINCIKKIIKEESQKLEYQWHLYNDDKEQGWITTPMNLPDLRTEIDKQRKIPDYRKKYKMEKRTNADIYRISRKYKFSWKQRYIFRGFEDDMDKLQIHLDWIKNDIKYSIEYDREKWSEDNPKQWTIVENP